MNRRDIIDLSSPVSVKSREDFIPFKAHLKPTVEDIVDLCTPVKLPGPSNSLKHGTVSSTILTSIVDSDEENATVVITENSTQVEEEETVYIDNSLEDEPIRTESIGTSIQGKKTPKRGTPGKEDKEAAKLRFFASLDMKKRIFTQSSSIQSSSSSSSIPIPAAATVDESLPVKRTKKSATPQKPSKVSDTPDLAVGIVLPVEKAAAAAPKKTTKPRAPKTPTVPVAGSSTLVCNAPLLSERSSTVRSSSHVVESSIPTSASSSSSTSYDYLTLEPVEKHMVPLTPGVEYEVVLIVDKREQENPRIQSKMVESNIPCELSTLAVGDFLWIARPKAQYFTNSSIGNSSSSSASSNTATLLSSSGNGGVPLFNEDSNMSDASVEGDLPIDMKDMRAVVLDCIAERKSTKDLASSIMDHRYVEQKARLRACGVRSCVYIVEGELVVSQLAKKMTVQHLKTAMIETHAEGNMHVFRTRSLDHTMDCLKAMHWQVVRRFKKGACGEMFQTFPNFQKLWGKKSASNYRQLFGYQLRQIQGCSKNIALPIINKYGTTHEFIREIEKLGKVQAVKSIADMFRLSSGSCTRRIGKVVAEKIWNTYMEDY